MMHPIAGVVGSSPLQPAGTDSANKASGSSGDSNPFEKLLEQTNQDQVQSENAIEDLVTGKSDDLQQVVMQVVKSELSFQLFMEVRNQLIDSYNELMRMQF